jgi:hypothetical protein
LQKKADPVLNGVSVTTLMATMAADLVMVMGKRCLLMLDAYFAVGPVFKILKKAVDADGRRLVHIVTRAKSNAVADDDPPAETGGRGRPRKYGPKLKLMALFDSRAAEFEQTIIDLEALPLKTIACTEGCIKTPCSFWIWPPISILPWRSTRSSTN